MLATWKQICLNTNVYRSLLLFSKKGENLAGPFLVDIDSLATDDTAGPIRADLGQALTVAREIGSLLLDQWHLPQPDLRLFFSGRKGFNFEVRPNALGITGNGRAQMQASERLQRRLKDELKAKGIPNCVDRVYGHGGILWLRPRHPFTRLHESINAWHSGGRIHRRRRAEVSLEDLFKLDINAIAEKSLV